MKPATSWAIGFDSDLVGLLGFLLALAWPGLWLGFWVGFGLTWFYCGLILSWFRLALARSGILAVLTILTSCNFCTVYHFKSNVLLMLIETAWH